MKHMIVLDEAELTHLKGFADTALKATKDYMEALPKDASESDLETMRDELRKVSTLVALCAQAKPLVPEYYWDADDGENAGREPEDLMSLCDDTDIMRLNCGLNLPDVWAAFKCLRLDAEGEPAHKEVALFDTEEGAARCWEDSVEALVSGKKAEQLEESTQ